MGIEPRDCQMNLQKELKKVSWVGVEPKPSLTFAKQTYKKDRIERGTSSIPACLCRSRMPTEDSFGEFTLREQYYYWQLRRAEG